MKVYVEKMPKECYCCVFNIEDTGGIGGYCIFGGGKKTCPLIPLSDYTKQVRKEVCEDLKNKILYCSERIFEDGHYYNGKELDEIVDQIQGETK